MALDVVEFIAAGELYSLVSLVFCSDYPTILASITDIPISTSKPLGLVFEKRNPEPVV
jgi:hypothetical protein